MKKSKLFALLLTSALVTSVMVGCGEKTEAPKDEPNTPPVEEPAETPGDEEVETPTSKKAGLGIITSIAKSKDMGDEGPVAQVDTTMAAVLVDGEGKIASISLDVAQNKVVYDKGLELVTDKIEMGKTKKELGAEYGMVAASKIGKEWFEQIEALETWMVGKTVEEIKGMKMVENVSNEEDLKTSVTIKVNEYIAAIEKAVENAVEIGLESETLGLGHSISLAKSKSAITGENPVAQVDNTIALTVLDKDGKITKTIIDTAQTKVEFDLEGIMLNSKEDKIKTKKELGKAYGMSPASAIGKEWFEQIEALEDWMVGKLPAEVLIMEIVESVPAEQDLKSSVTIKVDGYIDAFMQASELAR